MLIEKWEMKLLEFTTLFDYEKFQLTDKALLESLNNIVIPISRVVFGFGAGGSEFTTKSATKAFDLELSEELFPFGGGSGGGINIAPVAFLHVNNGNMEIINVNKDPSLLDKVFEIGKDLLINEDNKDRKKK